MLPTAARVCPPSGTPPGLTNTGRTTGRAIETEGFNAAVMFVDAMIAKSAAIAPGGAVATRTNCSQSRVPFKGPARMVIPIRCDSCAVALSYQKKIAEASIVSLSVHHNWTS